MASLRYAEVAVDAAVAHSRTFSYSVPPRFTVEPGQLVWVPFGRRVIQGLVVELADTPKVSETRSILHPVEPSPLIDTDHMKLGHWISSHYRCSLFSAMGLLLPPGFGNQVRSKLIAVHEVEFSGEGLKPETLEALSVLKDKKTGLDESEFAKLIGTGAERDITRMVDRGLVRRQLTMPRPRLAPKYEAFLTLCFSAESNPNLSHRQEGLLSAIKDEKSPYPVSLANKEHGIGVAQALFNKGLVAMEWVRIDAATMPKPALTDGRRKHTLTDYQEQALSKIREALEDPEARTRSFLLHGITGSGKTEVYLDAVKRCLELGKRAIVLVPEIALTYQTIERFATRFPGDVAVLHSGLSAGERFDQWWKIQQGDYDLVVGSRSSIFAPISLLGLIVIDEEHEWTYKQTEHQPRYHARDVAIKLSELTGATLLMGTASPDVATYYKALHREIRLLRLPNRITPERSSRPGFLAPLTVVDMRTEFRDGNSKMCSRQLENALHETIQSGSQAILFLNRRGTAAYTQCRSCGYTQTCKRCDTTMTYHRNLTKLLCHYCGDRRNPLTQCPVCLRYKMTLYGTGTEAVQHEVQRMFPDVSVYRWDRDTVRKPSEYQQLLDGFRQGDASILVGTQMIAKGLHIPSVTLVGVISADVGLGVPDYRASERVFQLLFQVAGRAGRGLTPGRAIIQTFQADNYAVRAASDQDYLNFYHLEIKKRYELNNPPYTKIIKLQHSHVNNAICEVAALQMSELLRNEREASGFSDVQVVGPTPGFPTRLRGHYRWQIILRGSDPRTFLASLNIPDGWTIDVDPVG